MRSGTIIKFSMLIFVLILAGNFAAYGQKTDCSKMSDTDLIIAIYQNLQTKYADEIKHINITITDGVVKLDGWATTEKIKKNIEKMVKKMKCVKSVLNELTIGKGGGCAPGFKECGGACIPEKDPCNICLIEPAAPGCLTNDPKKPKE